MVLGPHFSPWTPIPGGHTVFSVFIRAPCQNAFPQALGQSDKSVQIILNTLNASIIMLDTILWLTGDPQKKIFLRVGQPITATQLSRQTGISVDGCSYVLVKLAAHRLVRCLNPLARRSRLYWLTRLGKAWQRRLRELDGMHLMRHDFPDLDWSLYGDVCYSHRAAVIKCLSQPMQPAQIKRVARSRNPNTRMSANNVRDVIRFLRANRIAQPVWLKKKAHPRYQLTDVGRQMQRLLLQAEVG